MASHITALRRWLVFVALLRLFSVGLGYFAPVRLQSNLYTERPYLVNELQGRTFATWTLTSCVLCLICARDPRIPAIYGATLASFLIALLHFILELFVYKTVGLQSGINPLIVATISSLWMGAGWNYYTSHARTAEPTLSEETTVQPTSTKDD